MDITIFSEQPGVSMSATVTFSWDSCAGNCLGNFLRGYLTTPGSTCVQGGQPQTFSESLSGSGGSKTETLTFLPQGAERDVQLCAQIENWDSVTGKTVVAFDTAILHTQGEPPGNIYDCANFTYQDEAQAYLEKWPTDPSQLDGDDDGIACEVLPRRGAAAPSPPSVTLPSVQVHLACGLGVRARPSSICGRHQRVGAFFLSPSEDVRYMVCVRFPTRREICTREHAAQAGVTYANKITSNLPGRHRIVWRVGGRKVATRYLWVRR
jgi:hypothetical protein